MNTLDLAAALRELTKPWLDSDAAAAHLGYESTRHFRERVAVLPDFPAPRYFGGSAMRWKRSELDAWADQQTERRQSSKSAKPDTSGA